MPITVKLDPPWRIVQRGGLSWWVCESALDEVENLCIDVERALSNPAKAYKNSPNVTVAAVLSPSGRRFIVRRTNYGKWRHRVKDVVRPSRARRAFVRGLRLEQAGIPTPRMLAVAELRTFRWPLAAWLISDEVPGARSLAYWLRTDGVRARHVTNQLARVVATMHDRGFIHRDLKPGNVLLDGDLNPWLIDMDGVHFVGKVSLKQATRDLSVLAKVLKRSPQLRHAALRFLAHYCKHRRLTSDCRQISQLIT